MMDLLPHKVENAKMQHFAIPVTRIGYSHKTFNVVAESREEALKIANELTGDYCFSESSAEYEMPKIRTEQEQQIDFLNSHLEANPELATFLYKLMNGLVSYDLRSVISLLKGADYNKAIDCARPQEWTNKMVDEMQLTPTYIVWNYNEKSFGAPYNVAAEVLKQLTLLASKTR